MTGGRDAACVVYRVDLSGALPRSRLRGGAVDVKDALLLAPSQFLWLPEGQSEFSLEFILPRGYQVD